MEVIGKDVALWCRIAEVGGWDYGWTVPSSVLQSEYEVLVWLHRVPLWASRDGKAVTAASWQAWDCGVNGDMGGGAT